MFRVMKGLWTIALPVSLSVLAVVKHSVLWLVLFVLAHFLILAIVPAFKRRENLWMFIIFSVTSIPLNVKLIRYLCAEDWIYSNVWLAEVVKAAVFYLIFLSVEQIVMGLITRRIWMHQKDVFEWEEK